MNLFVDTSVWSLALRRDILVESSAIDILKNALLNGETVLTTGLIIQELLQGFSGTKAQAQIIDRFQALPLLNPSRKSHHPSRITAASCNRARNTWIPTPLLESRP